MSWYDHGKTLPLKAASAHGQGVAVWMNIASSRDEMVLPAADSAADALGLTIASVPTFGLESATLISGVGKARAAASVGAGALVAAASTNGALGPALASGITAHLGSAGAVAARYAVGRSLTAAGAGEFFACLVDPRQIV